MSGITFTMEEFNSLVVSNDFQRSNMFSLSFATKPTTRIDTIIDDLSTSITDLIPSTMDSIGIKQNELTNAITTVITMGSRRLTRKAGVSRVLLGAMSNRVFQTLLGQINVGSYIIEFFDKFFPTSGLWVQSVKIPDNRIGYEMDKLHNAPNIKFTGREYEPLVVTFRMDSAASNYRAMNDWLNSVEDPHTGLRALPSEVESDIQVNLHDRNGIPHTVCMFTGCVPSGVTSPQVSFEENNTITTFDVTFAYRVMSVGAVGPQAAKEWIEDMAINLGKQAYDPIMQNQPNSRLR